MHMFPLFACALAHRLFIHLSCYRVALSAALQWSWVSFDTALATYIDDHCPDHRADTAAFARVPPPGPID